MKKTNFSLHIFLVSLFSVMMLFTLTITASAAFLFHSQEITGKISLGDHIHPTYTGLLRNDGGELLLQYKDNDEEKIFQISDAEENSTYVLVNPCLTAPPAPVFMRAKLILKDDTDGEISDSLQKDLFSTLPVFDSAWTKKEDGWYYYSKDFIKEEENQFNSEKISSPAAKDQISLFETAEITLSHGNAFFEAFNEVNEVNLTLRLEYVGADKDGYSAWFPEKEFQKIRPIPALQPETLKEKMKEEADSEEVVETMSISKIEDLIPEKTSVQEFIKKIEKR